MNTNFKSILIPVNFNSNSEVAVDQAAVFAKMYDLEIILLHVVPTSSRLSLFTKKKPDNESYVRDVEQQLEVLSKRVTASGGVQVRTMIEKSRSSKAVARIAELFYAKFIICVHDEDATTEERRIKAEEIMDIVENSRAHVITLSGKRVQHRFRNLILPLDLTKETRQKIPIAIEMAKLFQSTLRLVTIRQTVDQGGVTKLNLQIKQVEKYVRSNHVEYTTDIVDASAEDVDEPKELLSYSKKVFGDMVLVMTHQDTKNNHAMDAICQSEIPVMSVIAKNIGSVINF